MRHHLEGVIEIQGEAKMEMMAEELLDLLTGEKSSEDILDILKEQDSSSVDDWVGDNYAIMSDNPADQVGWAKDNLTTDQILELIDESNKKEIMDRLPVLLLIRIIKEKLSPKEIFDAFGFDIKIGFKKD